MRPKLEIYMLAAALLILAWMAWYKLLVDGYSLSALITAGLMLTPHLMVLMMGASRLWVGAALGGIGLTFTIPLPLLYRIELGMVLVTVLMVLVILRSIFLSRKVPLVTVLEDRLMLVIAAVVLVRILYDRPGSAQMGESGGLAEAFYIGLGVVSYFMMLRLVTISEWRAGQTFWTMMVLVIIGTIIEEVRLGLEEDWETAARCLFGLQMWFLLSMLLAWSLARARRVAQAGPQFLPYVLMAITLVLSVLTPFRSRPVFAVAIIMTVTYVYGRMRRFAVIVGVGLGVAALAWSLSGSERVPFMIARSVSTIMPASDRTVLEYVNRYNASTEFGWESDFRAELNRMAWERIRERPLMGKGFAFTRDELVMQSYATTALGTLIRQLAISGVYHNAILELAVSCGLPLAALFVIAYLSFLIRFLLAVPTMRDPGMQLVGASLIGFFAAESGQMLMNGGGRDFYFICLLMGAMRGLTIVAAATSKTETAPAKSAVAT